VVIWETGLGGRLDATNIVTPLASVITNVQFDHEQWLGDTLAKIAAEKAGIIKPAVPVITAADAPEALTVIRAAAQLAGAPLTEVDARHATRPPLAGLQLPLVGDHQRLNAAVALATIDVLQEKLPVPLAAVVEGLCHVDWAGRMQAIGTASGQVSLLDGAHNPAGMHALEQALRRHYPGQRPAILLGILRDKDWRAMCDILLPLAKSFYLVPVASARTTPPEELRAVCAEKHLATPLHVCHSLVEALHLTQDEPFRLVTGSLYLVGEALELLGALRFSANGERSLNEWQRAGQARG
jgi:dihydrofolate synthase/folylpolyglutamate synthase